MKSTVASIALSIFGVLAALHAIVFSVEWIYQRWPSIGRVSVEVVWVGAILIVLIVGFSYIVRTLHLRLIVGVAVALVYFPVMLYVHFWLSVYVGLYDAL